MLVKRTCAWIGICLGLAGCQTAGTPAPLAYTVTGEHTALASCFAQAQPDSALVVSDAPSDRTISVDVNASKPDAFRLAFAPLTGTTTQVSAAQNGPGQPNIAWSHDVLPALGRCIRQTQG